MTRTRTIPLLPCRSIDEIRDFYLMLGFEVAYRQERPNPYLAVRRGELDLHFFGMPDFVAEDSYGSCLVYVPDVGELYEAFAAGMRARHGKLLIAGIPRMTRPRTRRNTGRRSGFSVVDPGGNWIRIFQAAAPDDGAATDEAAGARHPTTRFARTLENAIVLGDSKGDHRQAARILDAALSRSDNTANVIERVEALVYRADLAVRSGDSGRVDELLAEVRATALTSADRGRLAETLEHAERLGQAKPSP